MFYALIIFVCDRIGYRYFSLAVFLEVLIHMAGATIFTGLESGFQTTLIGIVVLIFYDEYILRRLKEPAINALPLVVGDMAVYLFLCIFNHFFPARYPLPESVCFWLQVFWGVIVFSIMIGFSYIIVNIASGSEEILTEEVEHDMLTGLSNRYFVANYLGELKEKSGLEGHWAAMMDIDNFKNINDSYGHNCGDYVLRELAELLRNAGEGIQANRWGGEEFLLLGKTKGDPDAVCRMLDEFQERVTKHKFSFEGTDLYLTVTIGFAEYCSGYSIHDWVNEADQKLYEGKRKGKNCLVA